MEKLTRRQLGVFATASLAVAQTPPVPDTDVDKAGRGAPPAEFGDSCRISSADVCRAGIPVQGMTDDIFFATIPDLNARLKKREFSTVELVRAFAQRLDAIGPRYNA